MLITHPYPFDNYLSFMNIRGERYQRSNQCSEGLAKKAYVSFEKAVLMF